MTIGPADLTALDARDRLARGEVRAAEIVEACLHRIDERESQIGAWAHLDRELALSRARAADEHRATGRPIGALHGLPVGVKDIVDTADMPTENGTAIDSGRKPRTDATVVSRLRAAGAIVFGKTATTELAFFQPAATRNPRAPQHTPGGSSSGSAAAVASAMVPLAIGTQTAGSVIRPASFCGVVGFKPTFGLIPRTGILRQSEHLDTVGVFGRQIEDVALLADALAGYDPGDTDTAPAAPPGLLDLARSDPPVTPALAFVQSPAWPAATADTSAGFEELCDALGEHCDEVDLPSVFAEGAAAHQRINVVEMARNFRSYYQRGRDLLSARICEAIEEGLQTSAVDYLSALDWRAVLYPALEEIFRRYDAIITPAAPGEAPVGLDTTGSPVFNRLWTLLGVPAVSVPLLTGANGLPVGVQLVGRRGYDGRLLRTARWLVNHIEKLK